MHRFGFYAKAPLPDWQRGLALDYLEKLQQLGAALYEGRESLTFQHALG